MKRILVLTELRTHFAREVYAGLCAANDQGRWWKTMRMSSQEVRGDVIGGMLAQVDGVIARDVSVEIMEELVGQEVPAVVVRSAGGDVFDAKSGLHEAAHVDDAGVGALAVEELKRLSVKHWGYVGFAGVGWSRGRGEALMNGGAKVHALELTAAEREGWGGVLRLMKWLRGLPKPIGVFGCSDAAGAAILQACDLAGIRVPSEVAVIGVDNDVQLCHSSYPALSSIDLQAFSLGRRAAWQLAVLLGLEVREEPLIEAPKLVVRESSHDVDRYFLYYRKTVEWLEGNALRGPSVEEIARVVGISRRGLERAFDKHAQRSPAMVVREYRMQAIKKLLGRETLLLDRVATQAGFADAAGLSNFVKRQSGMTPRDLRESLLRGED